MRRYLWDWINDDFALFDNLSTTLATRTLRTYDPEKFEVRPKDSYKSELIKQKEQEIENIEKRLAEKKEELKALKSG